MCERLFRAAANDRRLVARKFVFGQQVADFHFHQIQQFLVVHKVNLVQENHNGGHADLARQEHVLLGLWHRAFRGIHHKNGPVHLRRAGNHVFNEVGMTGTVNVGIVPFVTLILDVRNRDGHRLGFVTHRAALGDVGVGNWRRQPFLRLHLDNRSG